MPTPPGFVGALYDPQRVLLRALLDVEACPLISVGQDSFIEVSAARVAERFSFGKTVLFLALIHASPAPACRRRLALDIPTMGAARPCVNYLNVAPVGDVSDDGGSLVARRRKGRQKRSPNQYGFKGGGRGFLPRLTMGSERMIPATLVIAASSVISQWEDNIRRFTPSLRFFTIDGVGSLAEFHRIFHTRAIAHYDIVLLKVGKVTAKFRVPGEPRFTGKERSLLAALASITDGLTWARVVADDCDTVRFRSDDQIPPALFVWIVSATRRTSAIRRRPTGSLPSPDDDDGEPPPDVDEQAVQTYVRKYTPVPFLGMAQNALFDSVLRFQCDVGYVDRYISTTVLLFRRVVVRGGQAAAILEGLGVDDDIVEMINAGAVTTAADALGIRCVSVRDIVERVLTEHTRKYRKAVQILARIAAARVRTEEAAVLGIRKNTKEEAHLIRSALKGDISLAPSQDEAAAQNALRLVGAPGQFLNRDLKTLEELAESDRDEHGMRLDRMRKNLAEECCLGCAVPIEGESYILGCCQVIVCGHCAVVADRLGKARHYLRRCPNCAADVRPQRDLLYVGSELDMGGVVSDDALFIPEEAADGDDVADEIGHQEDVYAEFADDFRLKALLQHIRGDSLDCIEETDVPPYIEDLLEGRQEVERPADTPRRHIVFTMYPESTRKIAAGLEKLGVVCVWLKGTRGQKENAVRRFKADLPPGAVIALLITSSNDCSGLHLPEATHVDFYHCHIDPNVTRQAAGRAQRVGRTCSAVVTTFVTEAERRRWVL